MVRPVFQLTGHVILVKICKRFIDWIRPQLGKALIEILHIGAVDVPGAAPALDIVDGPLAEESEPFPFCERQDPVILQKDDGLARGLFRKRDVLRTPGHILPGIKRPIGLKALPDEMFHL